MVDEELLAFGRMVHFLSVFGDEGVEVGVEPIFVPTLRSEDATCAQSEYRARVLSVNAVTESLSLLAARTKMRGDLN